MTGMPSLTPDDFRQVLAEHERLIEMVNELEYRLHGLSGGAGEDNVRALQQAAGSLVSAMRHHLFRQDQIVLPIVEASAAASRPGPLPDFAGGG